MSYAARKIFLRCEESVVGEWAAYMLAHKEEMAESLAREQVRHEMWFMGRDGARLFLIGVMDTDDKARATSFASRSELSVDATHRRFKRHRDRHRIEDLPVVSARAPRFEGCELLFEIRQNPSGAEAPDCRGPGETTTSTDSKSSPRIDGRAGSN